MERLFSQPRSEFVGCALPKLICSDCGCLNVTVNEALESVRGHQPHPPLFPVLVTGIQLSASARWKSLFSPKTGAGLDPRDKHEDEEGCGCVLPVDQPFLAVAVVLRQRQFQSRASPMSMCTDSVWQ